MRILARAARLSFLACVALGGACDAPDDRAGDAVQAATASMRAVVAAPLTLTNTRSDALTHPLWGGSFVIDEPVEVRISATARGRAGLLFGRRVDPEQKDDRSPAVELAFSDRGWRLNERAGDGVVRYVALPSGDAVSLTFTRRSVRARVGSETRTLSLSQPLEREVGSYVRLERGGELTLRDVAIAQVPPPSAALGEPLRSRAGAHGVGIGAATDIWPPLSDARFEALLGEQFDVIGATELYWSTTRGEDDGFDFVPADLMVNYAAAHRQQVHGYFLVWDFSLPKWLEARPPSAIGGILDEHVRTTVSRYRGRVARWAVVNEAVWGPEKRGAAQYAENVWSDALGPAYIERAFRVARAADPDALLFYNETGAEELGPKSDFVYAMATDFLRRDVPIGGIGFQFHLDAATLPDMASVKANLERFGALGLEVHITELDVSLANVTGTPAAKDAIQARVYADVMATCLAVPACRSTTVFGVSDRHAWNELGDASPLLFDEAYAAKPAFFALQRALSPAAR